MDWFRRPRIHVRSATAFVVFAASLVLAIATPCAAGGRNEGEISRPPQPGLLRDARGVVRASSGITIERTQTLSYEGSGFGRSLAVSGKWLAATLRSSNIKCCPAAVFEQSDSAWQPASLVYGDLPESTLNSVVRSSGSRIAQGLSNAEVSSDDNAGRVFVYVADPDWKVETEIHSPAPAEGAFFGWDVALDGETLAVSANSGSAAAVYVYQLENGAWVLTKTLNLPWAYEIALSGDWLAVLDVFGTTIHIYHRSNGNWTLTQTVAPPTGETFGSALDMDGGTIAVGSAPETIGKVFIYDLTQGQWAFSQQLDASDRTECTYLGQQIDMAYGRLLVGAQNACVNGKQGAGLARLYEKTGSVWTFVADLTDVTPEQGEWFGFAVALSWDQAFVDFLDSGSNWTTYYVSVYSVPRPSLRRQRPVRRP